MSSEIARRRWAAVMQQGRSITDVARDEGVSPSCVRASVRMHIWHTARDPDGLLSTLTWGGLARAGLIPMTEPWTATHRARIARMHDDDLLRLGGIGLRGVLEIRAVFGYGRDEVPA